MVIRVNHLHKKIGSLYVKELLDKQDKWGAHIWLCVCVCDCGNVVEVVTGALSTHKDNCGCKDHPRGDKSPRWKGYEDISGFIFNDIKKKAISRNLEFSVDMPFLWDLYISQNKKCALSGLDIKFTQSYDEKNYKTASLDRIDSSKGYTEDNIQWLHKMVNMMKANFPEDYFIYLCSRISNESLNILNGKNLTELELQIQDGRIPRDRISNNIESL